MWFSRKRGFTLWEILVIVVVISVWMMSIISLLTYGLSYVQKSRQRIIAINLAREWIEAVYQIRDTNRQRWAGRKEECRLKTNPLVDSWSVWCSDDIWIQSGIYILDTHTTSGQTYFFLTGYTTGVLDISSGIGTWDLMYSLCFSGGLRMACPGVDMTTSEGRYFREIRWYGLFAKDTAITWWQYMTCTSGQNYFTCGSATAKEFRFCSKVVYVWFGTWEVELCGLLTNFMEK